jgi:hypothetical protein
VNFVSLRQQGFDKIHPEIVDIPGGVKDYSNSHGLR